MTNTSRGYVAIPRELFDDPRFKAEPYTERLAFMWLVAEASWRDRQVRNLGPSIDLKRGELMCSNRYMAKAWRWSEARVRRFIARLQIDALIDARPTQIATHITIRNYDQFSLARRTAETETDAPTDPSVTQIKNNNHSTNQEFSRREQATGNKSLSSAWKTLKSWEDKDVYPEAIYGGLR